MDSEWSPNGVLVPSVRVNSAWPVLGIPSRTGIPLGLRSDWTGTGTDNLAEVGWWTSPSGLPVESE